MKVDQARRLKELEQENAKLKRLVSELSLEKLVLKDIAPAFEAGAEQTQYAFTGFDRTYSAELSDLFEICLNGLTEGDRCGGATFLRDN